VKPDQEQEQKISASQYRRENLRTSHSDFEDICPFPRLRRRRHLVDKHLSTSTRSVQSGINILNILRVPFSYESVLCSFSINTIWLCNFLKKEY